MNMNDRKDSEERKEDCIHVHTLFGKSNIQSQIHYLDMMFVYIQLFHQWPTLQQTIFPVPMKHVT